MAIDFQPLESKSGIDFQPLEETKTAVRPGDVAGLEKVFAAQDLNAPSENVARERLGGNILTANNPGEAVLNSLKGILSEAAGGVKDIFSGVTGANITPEMSTPEKVLTPVRDVALGITRAAASPLAPLTDIASEAGQITHKLLTNLGLETGADVGAAGVQSALDVLAPIRAAQTFGKINLTSKSLMSNRMKETALKGDLASSAAKSEAEVAALNAEKAAVAPTAAEQIGNIRGNLKSAKESVESIAQAERDAIPSAAQLRERFAKNAPLGEDVGTSFKGTYKGELASEKQRFNTLYEDALQGTKDVKVDPTAYQESINAVLGEKGVTRPLPTQAEAVANKAKGILDVGEEAADQMATFKRDIQRAADPNSKKMLEDAMHEFMAAGEIPAEPTVNDMVKELQRLKQGQRAAQLAKNDNLTRQFNTLIDGVQSTIPQSVLDNLQGVNDLYRTEFVPFFGRKSVTRAIAEGAPQSVVDSIVRPATDKNSVEKVQRAFELVKEPAQREAITKAFTNKGIEEAFTDGAFDPSKFTKWWERYSDRAGTNDKVLRTVFGDGYDEMKSVVRQMQGAKRQSLEDVAAQLTKGFKGNADTAIAGVKSGVKAEEKAIGEKITSATAAQKLLAQQLEKQIKEVAGSSGRIASRLESIGSGVFVSGSLRMNPATTLTGAVIALSAKGVGALLETARGRSLFKAILRGTPGTSQAAATARQVQNFMRNVQPGE